MKIDYYIFFILILLSINILCQEESNEIKKDDFNIGSRYYNNDFIKKFEIYDYLKNVKSDTLNLRSFLLSKCFNLGVGQNKIENDSLSEMSSLLNSLGNSVFCIEKIDTHGNVHYYLSRSKNLSIKDGQGIMTRN